MKKIFALIIVITFLQGRYVDAQLSMPLKDKFHIGYHGFFYHDEGSNWGKIFNLFDSLKINFMLNGGLHFENGLSYNDFTIESGWKDKDCSDGPNISALLKKWNSFANENSILIEREKISRPAFGQLSDYQAEFVGKDIHPRYGYEHINGVEYSEVSEGESITGIKTSDANQNNSGYYMLSGLYENLEQTDSPTIIKPDPNNHNYSTFYYYSDVKDPDYKWFVLPRMRIDKADALSNSVKPVCRIVILNYSGKDSVFYDLYTADFRKADGSYNGEYLENYFNPTGKIKEISILASTLNNGDHSIAPKVDYKILWYGKVNIWLDRVRVADEWGYYLFYPELDLKHKYDFTDKISAEMSCELAGGNKQFGYCYIDEYKYNNIPCIAEVNRLIKKVNPWSRIVGETNMGLLTWGSGLINEPFPDAVLDSLASKKAVTDFLFKYNYTFTYKRKTGTNDAFSFMPLPPNLKKLPDTKIFPGTVNYYKSRTAEDYNDTINYWLQNRFENGYMRNYYYLEHLKQAANFQKKYPDVVFCAGTQVHNFENPLAYPGSDVCPYCVLREPTNEEVKLQNYLAMCYGSKAILQFFFPSNENTVIDKDGKRKKYYDWGMQDYDSVTSWTHNVREYNYYGQKKFDSLSKLNEELRNIGKILYEDNELKWDTARTVDKDGANFKFIADLRSYFRDEDHKWKYTSDFEDVKKYWEIGIFKNDPAYNDGSVYFILVNKRCVPEINSDGDLRAVKLYFRSSDPSLAGYTNWRLVDPLTNRYIEFNKNDANGVNVPGIFLAGEGKLLKLMPIR